MQASSNLASLLEEYDEMFAVPSSRRESTPIGPLSPGPWLDFHDSYDDEEDALEDMFNKPPPYDPELLAEEVIERSHTSAPSSSVPATSAECESCRRIPFPVDAPLRSGSSAGLPPLSSDILPIQAPPEDGDPDTDRPVPDPELDDEELEGYIHGERIKVVWSDRLPRDTTAQVPSSKPPSEGSERADEEQVLQSPSHPGTLSDDCSEPGTITSEAESDHASPLPQSSSKSQSTSPFPSPARSRSSARLARKRKRVSYSEDSEDDKENLPRGQSPHPNEDTPPRAKPSRPHKRARTGNEAQETQTQSPREASSAAQTCRLDGTCPYVLTHDYKLDWGHLQAQMHRSRDAGGRFPCTYPGCSDGAKGAPATYTEKCSRNRHIMAAHWGVTVKCPWPGCDKVYHRQDEVTRHLRSHREGTQKKTKGRPNKTRKSRQAKS